jgi:aryl-alcohol dehydrogenase
MSTPNGRVTDAAGTAGLPPGRTLPVKNPYTGEVDYQITPPTPAELTGICDSLRAAQVKWAAAPLAHRVEVMLRWADELDAAYGPLSAADFTDTGGGLIALMSPRTVASSVRSWAADGLAAVMAAKASGAAEIVAIDRVGHRLALAAELGATATIDTTGQELVDVAAAVVKLTGTGVDVALDTTGNPAVILAEVQSLATHGTASVITSSGAPISLPPGDLLLKGRQLRGTMGGHINPTIFIPRLLDLHARGRFPVDRLVRNYPFADLNTAIADSLSGATIKPVLTFGS